MGMIARISIRLMRTDYLYVILKKRHYVPEEMLVSLGMLCLKKNMSIIMLIMNSISVHIMKEDFAQRVLSADFIQYIIWV